MRCHRFPAYFNTAYLQQSGVFLGGRFGLFLFTGLPEVTHFPSMNIFLKNSTNCLALSHLGVLLQLREEGEKKKKVLMWRNLWPFRGLHFLPTCPVSRRALNSLRKVRVERLSSCFLNSPHLFWSAWEGFPAASRLAVAPFCTVITSHLPLRFCSAYAVEIKSLLMSQLSAIMLTRCGLLIFTVSPTRIHMETCSTSRPKPVANAKCESRVFFFLFLFLLFLQKWN